jgi:hypothetical protein
MTRTLSVYKKPKSRFAPAKFATNLALCCVQVLNGLVSATLIPRDTPANTYKADFVFWIAVGIGTLQIIALLVVYRDESRKEIESVESKATKPEPLEASLIVLYHCLLQARFPDGYDSDQEKSVGLRMAFMIPAPDNDKEIIQLTNYVGFGSGGIGRRFDAAKGIIGKSMRAKTSYTVSKPPKKDRITVLIELFGYTELEAKHCREAEAWSASYIADRDTRKDRSINK